MKTNITLKTSFILLFLFLSLFLFGQKRHALNFQFKQGIIGLEDQERRYRRYENFSEPGSEISIGLDYQFRPTYLEKRKFVAHVGVLWNFYSFARKNISPTNIFISAPIDGYDRTYQFKSHSILFPIRLSPQIYKISFSIGLIPRYHLKTELIYEEIAKLISPPLDYRITNVTYEAGQYIPNSPLNMGYGESASLKYKMDILYLLGFGLHLNERCSIEFELRDLVEVNYLRVDSEVHSGLGDGSSYSYEFSSESILVGVTYKIF